ncbi:MAG: EamA family transporter [Thermoanaerobaculaceae bacterium]
MQAFFWLLLVTGYLASALAFFTMAKVLTVLTPAEVAVSLAFEPVAAFAISALAGLEEITLSGVLGGALVAVGVVLAARKRD